MTSHEFIKKHKRKERKALDVHDLIYRLGREDYRYLATMIYKSSDYYEWLVADKVIYPRNNHIHNETVDTERLITPYDYTI